MSQQTTANDQFSPFQSIALCFSGGGFRAAAFSLGVLSYLNRVKINDGDVETSLLRHVNYIASTSGGTITNLLYSSYLFRHDDEEKAFRDCFDKLYADMRGETLLVEATAILADHQMWDQPGISKQRNVINAFSKVYDQKLFDGETFDVFWRDSLPRDFSVCFNATEFTKGISFRFQHESDKELKYKIGNRFIFIPSYHKEVLAKIKLGDILAASSCFPSGFEPIIFPEDFKYHERQKSTSWSDEQLKRSLAENGDSEGVEPVMESIALMDGGVTDNQAIISAMLADGRRRDGKLRPFDLIMVNDVTSHYMKPYVIGPRDTPTAQEKNLDSYLSKVTAFYKWFKRIRIIIIGVLLLSVAGIFSADSPAVLALCYFLSGVSILGIGLVTLIQYVINLRPEVKDFLSASREDALKKWISKQTENKYSPSVISNILTYLRETKLSNLKSVIMSRVNSIITMNVEVNLKHVRRLIYDAFYGSHTWDNRRASCFIYELSTQNAAFRVSQLAKKKDSDAAIYLSNEDKSLLLDLKDKIPVVADEAREMGTTLWFTEEDGSKQMLDKIIQCGQFTACANLLEYTMTLIRKHEAGKLSIAPQVLEMLKAVRKTLESDWAAFREQPDFYLRELKQPLAI